MSDDLLSDAFSVYFRYNWAIVGTVYSKMGGRGEPQNSKNFPWWAVEFGKRRRGIWQNLPRKVINYMMHMYSVRTQWTFIFSFDFGIN